MIKVVRLEGVVQEVRQVHRIAVVQIRHAEQFGSFVDARIAQSDVPIFDVDFEICASGKLKCDFIGLGVELFPANRGTTDNQRCACFVD